MSSRKDAEELFGKMRNLTDEERKSVSDYIKSISIDTGLNVYDLLGVNKDMSKVRPIDANALCEAMYHEAFETDTELQKWDSGCWIRYKMFENAIDNAPTLDTYGTWIPCEERLPESGNNLLLITAEVELTMSVARCIDIARFINGKWLIEGKEVRNKIIAWMPLPKPYERSE